MTRLNFNLELIQGLWKIRNRDPLGSDFRTSTRDWLRQCIQLERCRREVGS